MAPCHTLLSFILTVTGTLAVASPAKKNTFIVQVHHEAKPSIFPTHKHWYESSLTSIINHAIAAEPTAAAASAAVLHTYDTVFHDFSAKLSPLEAQKLESLSHIVAVIPEQVRQLHTTRSPQFLGLKTADRAGLLKETNFGSDLVIGVIDIGICPES
ncbi:subtilisin-like protease SBT1.5 [Arachis hypogaea]|uniref:subtilisin-like protease SBT1.5 n=1 Tax=Arachis hypogaea TaxID=3818 RepID=UPI003B0A37D2